MSNVFPFPIPKISEDCELLDLNDFISDGQKGLMCYLITGISGVDFIKPGYLVFVNPFLEPKKYNLIVFRFDGKICISQFEGKKSVQILGVAIAHLSVYGK